MVLCKIRELKRQNKKDLFIIIIYFFGLVLGYMKNDLKIKKIKKKSCILSKFSKL